MLYTAWLGGKLVEELGEAVKPVMEQQEKEQKQQESQKEEARPRVTERPHDSRGKARARQATDGRH